MLFGMAVVFRYGVLPAREEQKACREELRQSYAERRQDQIEHRKEVEQIRAQAQAELREVAAMVSREVVPTMVRMVDAAKAVTDLLTRR